MPWAKETQQIKKLKEFIERFEKRKRRFSNGNLIVRTLNGRRGRNYSANGD